MTSETLKFRTKLVPAAPLICNLGVAGSNPDRDLREQGARLFEEPRLMRHFATESGKSKGQFYTPAEVSRVIAQILSIREAKTKVTIYGQEKDATTRALASTLP